MLEDHVVVDGDIAGGLVGDMDIVTLADQPDEGSAHRDDIVVRVRGEDEDGLREGDGCDRAGAVVRIRLAAGPPGNRMLEVVEDLDVDFVERSEFLEEFPEGIVEIVLLGQFQDRFPDSLAEPDDGFPDELGRPVAGTDEPGGRHPGQQASGRLIDIEGDVIVLLEERGGTIPTVIAASGVAAMSPLKFFAWRFLDL